MNGTATATVKIENAWYGWARFDTDLSKYIEYIGIDGGFTVHAMDDDTLIAVAYLPDARTVEDAVRIAGGRVKRSRRWPVAFRAIAAAAA